MIQSNRCWNKQQKSLAALQFDTQFTPIVGRLLLLEDLRRQSDGSTDSPINDGMEIERLKQVNELLVVLQGCLDDIYSKVDETTDNSNIVLSSTFEGRDLQSKLMNQLNGIAIPLLNLLEPKKDTSHNLVIRSANYANVEKAAKLLLSLWKCLKKCIESDSKSNSIECIKRLVLPILVSCAMVLPSLEVARDNGTNKIVVAEGVIKKTKHHPDALDRGDDCAIAMLRLVQTIFSNSEGDIESSSLMDKDYQNTPQFSMLLSYEVANTIGGSLVARLVLGCLSLLTLESTIQDNDESGTNQPSVENSTELQLESLNTLCALISGIYMPELWRSIFPGCFAGLYRSIIRNLRYISVASAHKVASGSIDALSLLLKRSLVLPLSEANRTQKDASVNQSVISSLFKIMNNTKQESKKIYEDAEATKLYQSNEKVDTFKNEMNDRLPGPLSILLTIIPASRSRLVRKSGLALCHVILIDSMFIWDSSNMNTLERKAFEYCLTVLGDADVELQRCSRQLLDSYKSHVGDKLWRLRLSKSIVPAILELIEMLPIFAKSYRDSEVRNHLHLINGYLLVSFRNTFDKEFHSQDCRWKEEKSDIGSALGCSEASKTIKKSFTVIFTPDINTITVQPVIEQTIFKLDDAITRKGNHCFKFLYITEETIEMARDTIHLLASVLGIKRSALLIDSCFADLFQSCVKYTQRVDDALFADEQNWQLDWCGSCLFANEVLSGICSLPYKNTNEKRTSHEYRTFTTLAAAILPIVVSHPLWTLPTKLPHDSYITIKKGNNGNIHAVESTTIRSNAILVCALMRFICIYAKCLGEDMRVNMPTILLPLLQRASSIGNHSTVQASSFETIYCIALSSGYCDIFSLLKDNFDYIMDHISLELRRHSKQRTPASRSLMGVIDVVLRYSVCDDHFDHGRVQIVGHILKCILHYFDRLNNLHTSEIQALDTMCVFRSINAFMDSSIDARIKVKDGVLSMVIEEHWKARLDILDVNLASCDNTSDNENPFIQSDDSNVHSEENEIEVNTKEINNVATDFVEEIESINGILKRGTYIICHPDMRVVVLGLETLLCGFRSLGKISAYCKSVEGEAASNPLLPSIAEHWPSILARLKETSAGLHSKKMLSLSELSIRHMMAADQTPDPSDTSLVVLLSKLLNIVSELCTVSDGFFAGRFERDVYPLLALILGDVIPVEIDRVVKNSEKDSYHREKRYSALDPILKCIKSVYKSSCKRALAGLIFSCGTILLPLLAHTGNTGDEVMSVLKAMLEVDCDALWRPIHKLSGEAFPHNPLFDDEDREDKTTHYKYAMQLKAGYSTIMAQRAKHLLQFIEQLSDQEIY